MGVLGQESYRCSKAKRNEAPFDDDTALRRVLTARGSTGAVLAMIAVPSEKAEAVCDALLQNLPAEDLDQVECVASDNASTKLYTQLRRIMPKLQCLCLDPIHLPIVYERPARKRLLLFVASLLVLIYTVLHALLNEEYQRADSGTPPGVNQAAGALCSSKADAQARRRRQRDLVRPLGAFCYKGYDDRTLSVPEQTRRNYITSGAMPKARACTGSWMARSLSRSRLDFIEGLAAVAAEFPEDMQRKVTGANKAIDQILWCAAAADRAEWLLNNLRWRHRLGRQLRQPANVSRVAVSCRFCR